MIGKDAFMKFATDFRRSARDALRGRWGIAVLAGIVATILGGTEFGGPEIELQYEGGRAGASLAVAGQTIFSTRGGFDSDIGAFLVGSFFYLLAASIVLAVIFFVLGSVIGVGYSRFNLNLVDGGEGTFENLFAYFPYWKTTACTRFLKIVYIFLWSLLLVIPGVVASYTYAMTEYILADHPEMTAGEAIQRSKELMYGNRWRLFCLNFSFIGWDILCLFTFGIGGLWLNPYKQAAQADFYREISGTAIPNFEMF